MRASGLCGICEAELAAEQCPRCGTQVCRRHYARAESCCAACARGLSGPA